MDDYGLPYVFSLPDPDSLQKNQPDMILDLDTGSVTDIRQHRIVIDSPGDKRHNSRVLS